MPLVVSTPFNVSPNWVATITADAPFLWWRLGSPTANIDVSGNGRNGIYGGAAQPTVITGAIANDPDNARRWNGSGQVYYRNADAAHPKTSTSDFSLEILVNFTDVSTNRTVMQIRPDASHTSLLIGMINTTGVLQVAHVATNVFSPLGYNDGQWHHVVAVKRTVSSPADVDIEMWVDGVNVATTPRVANANNSSTTNTFFQVGANGSTPTGTTNPWNGDADEAIIWDYALTQTQIETHFLASGL